MKKLCTILLASILLLSFTMGFAAAEETKIGVSIMELTAYTWYLGVIDGVNQWAKDNPQANFVFQFEDSRSDVSTMLNNVDNLLTWGAKGIILFPADASSAIPTIKQYTAKGIPFVIGDYAQQPNSPEDIVWKTFVGHNMKALGIKSGEVAVEYLKTLGKEAPVCLFITRPTSGQVAADRFIGFSETILAAFPKAKIIEEGDVGAGSRDSSQSLMENVLQRETVIDVVSGHNDAEVVGAYNAAVAANRTEIKFIGIAGDKDVLTYVTNGNPMWLGEVLQNPVDLGYQATKAMYETLVEGKVLPLVWDLPMPEAITPANVANYAWQTWGWL
jgi:ABC-type sugar transport system substrate-binding protein